MLFSRKAAGADAPPKGRRSMLGRRSYDPPELVAASGGDPPPPTDHSAARAADPYAFEVAHRRLAWMFRLSAMTNIGLLAVVVIEASAISTLVPLQKVQLGLVRVEPSTDRTVKVDPASQVRVIPITKDTPGFDIMVESFVRRYTRQLLEIDAVSQDDRMQQANAASDTKFWERFMGERAKEIRAAIDSGLERSVIVESASKLSERDGVQRWMVAFEQVDSRKGNPPTSKKLHAYYAVTSRPAVVRESERFENPLGLRVLDIALKERGN
jgi:type IV secretory pathway component VirB8